MHNALDGLAEVGQMRASEHLAGHKQVTQEPDAKTFFQFAESERHGGLAEPG